MNLGFLIRRAEFAKPREYSGRGEIAFAVLGCVIWFAAIVVRLSFSTAVWSLTERIVEAASFTVFAAIPVFFGATRPGTHFAQTVLIKRDGLLFQLFTCALFAIYICLVKLLNLNPERFVWLKQLDTLILNDFWLNSILFLIGIFIILRLPFLLLRFRQLKVHLTSFSGLLRMIRQNNELFIFLVGNFVYVSLVNTSLVSTQLKSDSSGYYIGLGYFLVFFLMNLPFAKPAPLNRFMVFDFLLTIACVGSLFWFSRPFFSFGVFVGLNLFILVVIFGTGLGREHFGYSFQPRRYDIFYGLKVILIAALILVPIAVLLKFSHPDFDHLLPQAQNGINSIAFFLSYAVLFAFRVGIFEEILFRCGLMVFIRDQMQAPSQQLRTKACHPKQLVLLSAAICSIIFGICHIGNDPGAGISLPPLLYKTVYAVLATIAAFFYSLAFGETNRLWCSILIHGTVDTTAVLLLGASLTVPF